MRRSVELIMQVSLLVGKDNAVVAIANSDGKGPEAMPENTSMPLMMALCAERGIWLKSKARRRCHCFPERISRTEP